MHGHAASCRRLITSEVAGINLVDVGEISHIHQEDGALHSVCQSEPVRFSHGLEILEGAIRLGCRFIRNKLTCRGAHAESSAWESPGATTVLLLDHLANWVRSDGCWCCRGGRHGYDFRSKQLPSGLEKSSRFALKHSIKTIQHF